MMKYPNLLRRINSGCAVVAGILVCFIVLLVCMEAVLRTIGAATMWSSDITLYLFIYSVFLSAAYGFQEKGHIAVDFVQHAIGKKFGKGAQKGLTIVSYLATMFFLGIFMWQAVRVTAHALSLNKLTIAYVQIPMGYLYAVMLFGTVMMIITVAFIILDLCTKSDEYML